MMLKTCWKKTKGLFKKTYGGPWYKKILAWIVTFMVAVILFFAAVESNFLNLFGKSPGFNDIKNPVVNEASEIYSADSVLLGRFFSQNRTPVTYEEISPILVTTLIDTEDERFYKHHGIDVVGLFAALKDMFRGEARGGSTITQQLAKNLFRVRTQYSTGLLGRTPGLKLLIMKVKEWIVATKLEAVFSKEEILTMYFNTVDFGSNSFGIKTAARTYFSTTPDKLNYEQSATLVGLLKATSNYNPRLHPESSRLRRNTVLDLVYQHNHILINGKKASKAQLDSIKSIPIIMDNKATESSYDGIAPYFREALVNYISKLCEKKLIKEYDSETKLDLYADGLKIYTTLDTRLQKYAEEAVEKQMQVLQKRFNEHWGNNAPWRDRQYREIPNFIENLTKKTQEYKYLTNKFPDNQDSVNYYLNLPHPVELFTYDGPVEREISTIDSIRYMTRFMHCGFVVMEPDTRQVKAWVGDIDFNSWKYDKVLANRQPGSTFKLFVYTEAMNQGLTPCDRRLDGFVAYKDTINGKITIWAPHNANGYFTGANMSLKNAFAQSINSVAVKIGMEVGIPNIVKTAHAMGIESTLNETKSLTLGSSDVNLLEMVNSYCTVVNDGKYNMPIMVTRIEDRKGRVIYQAKLKETQAIPYRSAYLMQTMLMSGLTNRGGTSAALWRFIRPFSDTDFGGKTGTSNNHSDAWFIGITPKLVGGAWVGGEYRSIHFRTGELGQGSRTALPIFGNFVEKTFEDHRFQRYRQKFPPPKGLDASLWNCSSYYVLPDTFEMDSIYSNTLIFGPSVNTEDDTETEISEQQNEEVPTQEPMVEE
ncbi:MAG: penicillin-binding protein [Bacteroidaceae bacterium]|nr:penicillin-binding protein [Bacteroidaceae bacterium]